MIWVILIIVSLIIAMACRALVHNLLHHFYDTDKKFNLVRPVVESCNKLDK